MQKQIQLNLSDKEIVERLICRDKEVTRWFFYEKCKPLLLKLIPIVYDHHVEYDEVVNEVWMLLMEEDAKRLRSFGYRSSLCMWLKVVCLNRLRDTKKKNEMVDSETKESPYDVFEPVEVWDPISQQDAKQELDYYFSLMDNPRYVYVLKRRFLDDSMPGDVARELDVSVDTLNSICSKALKKLRKVALNSNKI